MTVRRDPGENTLTVELGGITIDKPVNGEWTYWDEPVAIGASDGNLTVDQRRWIHSGACFVCGYDTQQTTYTEMGRRNFPRILKDGTAPDRTELLELGPRLTQYNIRYGGCVVKREGASFFLKHSNRAGRNAVQVDAQKGFYDLFGIRVLRSDVWINRTKVVEQGLPLCYTIRRPDLTLTREPGKNELRLISNGANITQPVGIDWMYAGDSPPDIVSVSRHGDVEINGTPVVISGRSCENGYDPRPEAVISPLSDHLIDSAQSEWCVKHRNFRVYKYRNRFRFDGPGHSGGGVGLQASSTGKRGSEVAYRFDKGNVWIYDTQVIKDCEPVAQYLTENPAAQ